MMFGGEDSTVVDDESGGRDDSGWSKLGTKGEDEGVVAPEVYSDMMIRWVDPLPKSSSAAGAKKRDSQLGMGTPRDVLLECGEALFRVPRKAMDWKACFKT